MIVIIGAGLAGLAAGQELLEANYEDFIIIEAQDCVGGRVKSQHETFNIQTLVYRYKFDLGAEWLYGGEENPIYEWLLSRDYIERFEMSKELKYEGVFATQNGEQISMDRIELFLKSLTEAKRMFCDLNHSITASNKLFRTSLLEVSKRICQYFCKQEPKLKEQEIMRAVRQWFELRECVENSCERSDDLSTCAYDREHTDKVMYVDWQRVVNKMADSIGRHRIYLSSPVDYVTDSEKQVKVVLINGISIKCDHVILTISPGALQRPRPWKKSPASFVQSTLSTSLEARFDSVGFGPMTKIFLKFKGPVLEQLRGLKLLWLQEPAKVGLPGWTSCIEGLYLDQQEPYLLIARVGGSGSLEAEKCSDERIGQICLKVLKTFLPNEKLPELWKVVVSRWSLNPYIRGSNSYPSVRGDQYESIWEPIYGPGDRGNEAIPQLLFAGEANAGDFHGTAHGAILSGQREARRLLEFLRETCDKQIIK